MIEPGDVLVKRYFLDNLNTPIWDWTVRALILLISVILIGTCLYIMAKRK